jgi:hypothetical protein
VPEGFVDTEEFTRLMTQVPSWATSQNTSVCWRPHAVGTKKNLAGEPQSAIVHCRHCALPPLCVDLASGGVGCPPTENARQFSVSCVLTGSAAAPEIAVVPIKSAFPALRSVP